MVVKREVELQEMAPKGKTQKNFTSAKNVNNIYIVIYSIVMFGTLTGIVKDFKYVNN